MLAQTAQLFGQRPSALLGVTDPRLALVLDDALAQRLLAHQAAQQRPGRYSPPPPGTTYEDPMAVAEAEARLRREQQVH